MCFGLQMVKMEKDFKLKKLVQFFQVYHLVS